MQHSLTSLVEEARNEVRQVRDWLLYPTADTMNACVPALEHTVRCLKEVSQFDVAGLQPSSAAGSVALLAAELRQAQALFDAAGPLYLAVMRRVSTSSGADLPPDQRAEPFSALG